MELRDQITKRCVYFNGIQHDECEAGIRYDRPGLKDAAHSMPGHPGFPCLMPVVKTCDKRRLPTTEEVDWEIREDEEVFQQFMYRLANGLCVICGQEVTKRNQVGKCVYAEPCGHRKGQGKA